jgi:hypothetical protein
MNEVKKDISHNLDIIVLMRRLRYHGTSLYTLLDRPILKFLHNHASSKHITLNQVYDNNNLLSTEPLSAHGKFNIGLAKKYVNFARAERAKK